jgi:bidirectional [NiFe] hydrogenase diaphorase subunit
MSTVSLEIDGKTVTAEEGANLLEVARKAGADIPTLCYDEKLSPAGVCRLCMVEVTKGGRTKLVASCCYPVEAGLVVKTSTPRVENIRKTLVELLLPMADTGPVTALAAKYGLKKSRFESEKLDCVLCGLCVQYCAAVKKANAVYFSGRGVERRLALLPGHGIQCESCKACWELCKGGWIASAQETMDKED